MIRQTSAGCFGKCGMPEEDGPSLPLVGIPPLPSPRRLVREALAMGATQEAIEKGVMSLAEYDPRFEDEEEAVARIFLAMKDCLSSTLAICRRKPLQNKGLTLPAR